MAPFFVGDSKLGVLYRPLLLPCVCVCVSKAECASQMRIADILRLSSMLLLLEIVWSCWWHGAQRIVNRPSGYSAVDSWHSLCGTLLVCGTGMPAPGWLGPETPWCLFCCVHMQGVSPTWLPPSLPSFLPSGQLFCLSARPVKSWVGRILSVLWYYKGGSTLLAGIWILLNRKHCR